MIFSCMILLDTFEAFSCHALVKRLNLFVTFMMPRQGFLPPVPQARSLKRGDFILGYVAM